MAGFAAVLDANVLYPAPLRDFLLSLASVELFDPRWSAEIQQEWMEHLLVNRQDLKRSQLNRTERLMNEAFPDANISGYEHLIGQLDLPDPNDRHVLAVAIHSGAGFLVTFNAVDFPVEHLQPFGVRLISPDDFAILLFGIDEDGVLTAFEQQLNRLRNPPQTAEQLLGTLENCGLVQTVAGIRAVLAE